MIVLFLKFGNYLLKNESISYDDLDYVTFYEKPFVKFERLLDTYIQNSPDGFKSFRASLPIWLREKLFQKDLILNKIKNYNTNFNANKLLFTNHHESHAASAFYPSPFDEACILTVDGVGEWASTLVSIGKNKITQQQINFPIH